MERCLADQPIDLPPTIIGSHGAAWSCPHDWFGQLWLVYAPRAHPLWSYYAVLCLCDCALYIYALDPSEIHNTFDPLSLRLEPATVLYRTDVEKRLSKLSSAS